MLLTDVNPGDLDAVLALNEASVPNVNSLDADQMRWFVDNAHYFRVVKRGNLIGGFLIGLRPGLGYQSPNYRWFCARHDDFGYIDRVAVSADMRRQGIASSLYDDFARTLRGRVEILTCEVNIRPANEDSLRFHERYGFRRVGTQMTESGSKEVALLEKAL